MHLHMTAGEGSVATVEDTKMGMYKQLVRNTAIHYMVVWTA